MKDLEGRIEPYILSKIHNAADLKISRKHLPLTYNRFDLAFKIYYLQYLNTPNRTEFRKQCYQQHIKAFSLGSYAEPGNPEKDDLEKFEDVFTSLLRDFIETGFDESKSLIPLAADGSILNGAHRVSTAIFLDKDVETIETGLPPSLYDYRFFKQRGIPDEMLDIAAQTFAEYDDQCFLALVWPAARGHDNMVEDVLSRIVYKKTIRLNYNGAHNLLSQTYKNEPWLGDTANNHPGVKNKLTECFPSFDPIRAYLFQADSLEKVFDLKDRVRRIFNIDKHAIHITDTKEETLRVGRLLLNDNAVHFLNNANPNKFMALHEMLALFKSEIARRDANPADYVLDSGLVMAAYGLRSANDIDYLTRSSVFNTDLIEHHAKELPYHGVTEAELVDNPKYHFWYSGVKFISLQQLHSMKCNRGETKDILDVASIKSLLDSNPLQAKLNSAKYTLFFMTEKIKTKLRRFLISSFKRLGIYNQTKSIYRKIFK